MEVKINISARHVHLTKEALDILFGHELHVRNMLNQVGQFASVETVRVKTKDGVIDNVRVIGPVRKYNQVELAKSDVRRLGINPPVRKSGVLNDAELVTIETDKGSITGNFAIIADRHVHFSPSDALKYGIVDDQILYLDIKGVKPGTIIVKAKITDYGFYEAHLDTDDANAFLITPGDIGELRKWVLKLVM
mgnify:FL=1